ncbi:MAG: hypothetical protein Q8N15_05820 [Bacillota bacterium]|nr:hypothetical protein [Bacillota bacterium]
MRSFDDIKDLIEKDGWKQESIGTQSEQSVHRAIKYWISPDPTTHEVRLNGRIADVFLDGRVHEIQTRNFAAIAAKIAALLERYPVTIVYPVIRKKTIYSIGPDGSVGKGRVAPRRKDVSLILAELHGLKGLLGDPGLDFTVVAFDASEYRSASAQNAKGRIDLYPCGTPDVRRFDTLADFRELIPDALCEPFTVKELAKALKMSAGDAARTALFLRDAHLAEVIGKAGRAYLFRWIAVAP